MIKKGFTLIEMLVVISVIGILASLAIVSFVGTQKSARDTQRRSDLKQYQNALEIFANKSDGLYPSEIVVGGTDASSTLCDDLVLETCSEDPRNADDGTFVYKYQSDGSGGGVVDGTKYVLWSKLENSADYWVLCSNGKAGKEAQVGFGVTGGECPL